MSQCLPQGWREGNFTPEPHGEEGFTPEIMGKEDIGMIKSIFPPQGSAAYQPFHLPGSNPSWLLDKDSFVVIILWWWEHTPSAPVLFLCRSEVLHNTQKLSSSPLGEGCKPGLSIAPAAFANVQLFKSFKL